MALNRSSLIDRSLEGAAIWGSPAATPWCPFRLRYPHRGGGALRDQCCRVPAAASDAQHQRARRDETQLVWADDCDLRLCRYIGVPRQRQGLGVGERLGKLEQCEIRFKQAHDGHQRVLTELR